MTVKNKPQIKIGGRGKIVEIYESLFSKSKNHVGRVLPEQWISEEFFERQKSHF